MRVEIPTPDSTVRAMAESMARLADFLAEAEHDHDTAVLVRKLREHKHANGGR